VKSQLRTHLDTKHQELAPHTRGSIVQAISQELWLQHWANHVDQVVFPRQDAAPLPHLPVYADGFKCSECGYINRSDKRIQEHGSHEHGWVNPRQRRRGRPGNPQRMWTTVSCQKFQGAGPLGRLFQVSGDAPVQPVQDMDSALVANMAATMAQVGQALREADRKPAAVQDDESRWSYTRWLNRTGWSRHLKGLDRNWLLDMVQKPTSEERALRDVCWAVEMVIWKAQQASHSTVVGMPAMILVNRREYGNAKGEKPFNAS
jgi:hypothetical protein